MIKENERFPDWNKVYDEHTVDQMAWFWPELDPDLKRALEKRNLRSGTFLDLGTGPGTQADALAKMGFTVTATDISHEAIRLANEKFNNIDFVQDDILNSKLNQPFDYIFDRGCFHVIEEPLREKYVHAVADLFKEGGTLFLKCFSDKNEYFGKGPFQFSTDMIEQLFDEYFDIESIFDTIYQGTRKPTPKALFVTMRKK